MLDYPEEFEELVRICLNGLYDFSVLQNNELVNRLVPDMTGVRQVQAARQIIIDKIEETKLKEEVDFRSRQMRPYYILRLRYVDESPIQEIMPQLALSHRQFYREHRRALEALSQALWNHLKHQSTLSQQQPTITIETEIRRAYNHPSETHRSDLTQLIDGAIQAVDKLAKQYKVSIVIHNHPHNAPIIRVPQSTLRQSLIWLLSQVVKEIGTGEGASLSVHYSLQNGTLLVEFSSASYTLKPNVLHRIINDETWRHFSQRLNLDCAISRDPEPFLSLRVPYQEHIILVIDDNPDVVDLFRRYASSAGYRIIGALDGSGGIEMAESSVPSLIILDVMLPEHDGWEVLQRLKSQSSTRSIPVFVCSVLETADLALSLGADGFLKKPPNRLAFLEILDQNVASTD